MCSTLAKTLKRVDPTRLNFTLMPRPWQNLGHPGRDLHEDTEDMVAKEAKGETSRVLGVEGLPTLHALQLAAVGY